MVWTLGIMFISLKGSMGKKHLGFQLMDLLHFPPFPLVFPGWSCGLAGFVLDTTGCQLTFINTTKMNEDHHPAPNQIVSLVIIVAALEHSLSKALITVQFCCMRQLH